MTIFLLIYVSQEQSDAFGLQINLKIWGADEIRQNQFFFVKLQSTVLSFCHLTNFFCHHHRRLKKLFFSVKSSWEVHWIIMFQKDAVCNRNLRIFNFMHDGYFWWMNGDFRNFKQNNTFNLRKTQELLLPRSEKRIWKQISRQSWPVQSHLESFKSKLS